MKIIFLFREKKFGRERIRLSQVNFYFYEGSPILWMKNQKNSKENKGIVLKNTNLMKKPSLISLSPLIGTNFSDNDKLTTKIDYSNSK